MLEKGCKIREKYFSSQFGKYIVSGWDSVYILLVKKIRIDFQVILFIRLNHLNANGFVGYTIWLHIARQHFLTTEHIVGVVIVTYRNEIELNGREI